MSWASRGSRGPSASHALSASPARSQLPSRRIGWSGAVALALAAASWGCARSSVGTLAFEVARALPHDTLAYTQGLLLRDGAFFESTGQYGTSQLRQVDVESGQVVRAVDLSAEHFGEGLAAVGDRLVQLTWRAGLAFVYDAATFEVLDTLSYEGEGWGLCHDGDALYMSDGSATLTRRDPATFEVLERLQVTRDGFSLREINELECVGDHVWANVYMSNTIVRIDKRTGEVTGELDAQGLFLRSTRPADSGAVLNGIAYDPASGLFYLTGKLWAHIFEVRISDG